ncbi:MAG: ATP-dependent helicase [Spirochaetaceae bacterium]|nr:ATP-dependent helicase [Spirochaetaceae bacterium]
MSGTGVALNPQQERAAAAIGGPVMVLAGAGSGKTRVITARLARMLSAGIDPRSIVALTFTNKAAAEMRERAGISRRGRRAAPTVSTFHALGLQLVRRYSGELGFRTGAAAAPVTVYDQQDSAALLREVARDLRLDADLAEADPAVLQRLVSAMRMGGAGVPDVENASEQLRGLVSAYRRRLRLYHAVDFDDLILLPLELLRGESGDDLRTRFSHVMVDEFQDTSRRQYQLLQGLGGASRNVCVVGDDDQSIYSWRGAEAANFDHFSHDFPERLEIKLEQNYRSTGSILAFANAVISGNSGRRPKKLWSSGGAGAQVMAEYPDSDADEAEWIVRRIRSLALGSGLRYADCAVLVRANNLTRALEEVLLREGIAYQVSGGMSFFSRREVRDLIAYLRVLANPDDDVSMRRIVNTPRRGLGAAALERITATAEAHHCSLYSAMVLIGSGKEAASPPPEHARVRAPAGELVELLERYAARVRGGERSRAMAPVLADLIDELQYRNHLLDGVRLDAARWKLANVDAVIDSLASFEQHPDRIAPTLADYLARTALVSRDDDSPDRGGDPRGRVQLMTIHAAKGLEFDTVFIAGADDGSIPHARALADSEANLAEERRLFYVAATRARRRLFITCPAVRRRRGPGGRPEEHAAEPSRFLAEIPAHLVDGAPDEQELAPEQASALFADLKRRLASR